LANKLQKTTFHFNTSIEKVVNNSITFSDGQKTQADFIIIATDPSLLIPNLNNQKSQWKKVDNLYFEVKNRVINLPMIGLVAEEDALINNFHYLKLASANKQIISVSVIKNHQLKDDVLVEKVMQELNDICEIEVVKLLKHYQISQALPDIMNVNYQIPHTETKLKDTIFLAGDVLSNGSLNAAMLNGESAARAVIEHANGLTIDMA
jgi:protoporphyrinogen oxidase